MNRHERFFPQAAAAGAEDDLGVEQAFLGALLMAQYGHSTQHLIERLTADDFSHDVHRIIFGSIQDLARQDKAPTLPLLAPLLEGIRAAPGVTAVAYLGHLLTASAPLPHAVSYAKAIREKAARRQLLAIGEMITASRDVPSINVSQHVGDIMDRLDAVSATLRERAASTSNFDQASSEVIQSLRAGPPEIIKTGLTDLDRMLGGWHRKELTILAARPGMGKSAFLFSSALSAAKQGTSSLIFSMEMPTKMVTQRMLSDAVWNRQTPIPYETFSRGLSEWDIQRLEEARQKNLKLPITIDDQPGLSASEIRSRVKRHIERLDAAGQRLDVVIIDHLGKVKASDRYAGHKVHETGEKTNAFAEMGKELDVAVIAAHQLNRGVEGRENKRPGLSDLRDSGDVEQDAETVMFLYRPAYYLQQRVDGVTKDDERKQLLSEVAHDLEAIIAKNRNGACGTVEMFIDIGSNAVRDGARR